MNKVILIGRLTRDPEIRYTQSENSIAVAKFNLAVDRRVKKDAEQKADFISCGAFGKTAETIEKYCSQGSKIAICGHIQTGNYTNKEGQKVYATDVIVDEFDFCESKKSEPKAPPAKPESTEFVNVPDNVEDSGLPFN